MRGGGLDPRKSRGRGPFLGAFVRPTIGVRGDLLASSGPGRGCGLLELRVAGRSAATRERGRLSSGALPMAIGPNTGPSRCRSRLPVFESGRRPSPASPRGRRVRGCSASVSISLRANTDRTIRGSRPRGWGRRNVRPAPGRVMSSAERTCGAL